MHGVRQLLRRDPIPGVDPTTMPDVELTTVCALYHELEELASTHRIPGLNTGAMMASSQTTENPWSPLPRDCDLCVCLCVGRPGRRGLPVRWRECATEAAGWTFDNHCCVRCAGHDRTCAAADDPRLRPELVLGLNAGLAAYESFGPTAARLATLLCAPHCYASAEACPPPPPPRDAQGIGSATASIGGAALASVLTVMSLRAHARGCSRNDSEGNFARCVGSRTREPGGAAPTPVPCLLTDYSKEAVRLAQLVLGEAGVEGSRLLECEINPFMSPHNAKSAQAGYDLPSFGNGFLYGAV
jgi:hypothetical protein